MTLRCGSPEVLTLSGFPPPSSTTSEQVASKPMPLTSAGDRRASFRAPRTASVQVRQISSEDCSTMSPASCQIVIGRRAVAMSWPWASKMPARALVVPMSTPTKACSMRAVALPWTGSPACVAAVGKDDAAGHQARGVRREEQDDRGNLLHPAEAGHRGSPDPGIIHGRGGLDELVERRGDVSRRHCID